MPGHASSPALLPRRQPQNATAHGGQPDCIPAPSMILDDILKAIGQLGDPRFLRVFAVGVVCSILALAGATLGLGWLAGALLPDPITLPWLGPVH
jgi:hypothetical protein